MKKVAVIVALLLSLSTLNVANATTHSPIACAKSSAKGHAPASVRQPTKPAKILAKKFTLTTNCGVIEITTVGAMAPITVTSLAALAKAKYFNASVCHRLTTKGIFVLQCGDPTASGSGSPTGWKGYVDENLPKGDVNNYPAGTVAMANSGPGTNGSQMFLVYADTSLEPNYTIWGTITKGLDLVRAIAAQGAVGSDANGKYIYVGDGFPAQKVELQKVTAR